MDIRRVNRVPRGLIAAAVLAALVLSVYYKALNAEFINYDDHQYVVANSHLHGGLTAKTLEWAFNVGYASNWHPITWMSHMADIQMFGLNPKGHHLVNLILHIANVVLLFCVLRLTTLAFWRSFMVAALFGLHPAHVESVAWVAERKDVLSTFFLLLTLWSYAKYVGIARTDPPLESKAVQSAKGRLGYYVLSLSFFMLGLMSKPMLVSLPLLLLLLDYWPLQRLQASGARVASHVGRLVGEKIPFFVLAACSGVLTIIAQKRGGSVVPIEVIPLDSRVANAMVSYLRYAGKLLWPTDFSIVYPYVDHWPYWLVGLGTLFVFGGITVAVWKRAKFPYFLSGFLWFIISLVPVIGLVQVGAQAMADRYTYIPSIGFFVILCWGIPHLLGPYRMRFLVCCSAGLAAIGICLASTSAQLDHWRDGISLFEHALEVTENNAVAHSTLGLAMMDKGRLEDAVVQYEKALAISPDYPLAHNNLGVALARLGRFGDALTHYNKALEINPKDPEAHFNIANALNPGYVDIYRVNAAATNRQGDAQQAREYYKAAIQLSPDNVKAYVNWGNLELTQGDFEAAISHYQSALAIEPFSALAYANLGNALEKSGKIEEAIVAYLKALETEAGDMTSRLALANLLAAQSRFEDAIPHYQVITKANPAHFVAWGNQGSCLAKLGKYEQAAECFKAAIQAEPKYPEAHENLGRFYILQGHLEQGLGEYKQAVSLQPDNAGLRRRMALAMLEQQRNEEALEQFSTLMKQSPDDPAAHYDLALSMLRCGKVANAIEQFREALRLRPNWVEAMNNLAWLLATSPIDEMRNGVEAVRLATQADELTDHKDPHVTGTLDAAYAEVGRFEEAMKTAQKACDLAIKSGNSNIAEKARSRLLLYQSGMAFREVGSK